ncbi:MAG TPA: hypothetical protein VJQ44_10320 [Gemmatimonadales bacterium]|nr:hypothetical protein [Gemmatimonadales bacterium]
MSRHRRSWVDAFDRVPVGYSPPDADTGTESSPEAVPLARHRRRARRRRVLALVRAMVVAVLTARRRRRRRSHLRVFPLNVGR